MSKRTDLAKEDEKIIEALDKSSLKGETLVRRLSQFERLTLSGLCGIQTPIEGIILKLSEFDFPISELMSDRSAWSTNASKIQRIRGQIAEASFRHLLKKKRIVFDYNESIESDSGLLDEYDPWDLTDFYIMTNEKEEISIEIKSVQEGVRYKNITIKDGKMNADYVVAIKLVSEPEHNSQVIVWGYQTAQFVHNLPVQIDGICPNHACAHFKLTETKPISNLIKILETKGLKWKHYGGS